MAFYKNSTMERMNLIMAGIGIHFKSSLCLGSCTLLYIGLTRPAGETKSSPRVNKPANPVSEVRRSSAFRLTHPLTPRLGAL